MIAVKTLSCARALSTIRALLKSSIRLQVAEHREVSASAYAIAISSQGFRRALPSDKKPRDG